MSRHRAACTCPWKGLQQQHESHCPEGAVRNAREIIRAAKRRGFMLAIENPEAVRSYQERGEWPEELT